MMVSLIPFRPLLANAFLTARLEWNENADTSALLRDLCVHYFGDPSVAAYYEHREAALAPILAQARLKATDPACRCRLQEEHAALLAVMERAQPMAQARLQQEY